jgi:hypothetical protein
MLCAMLAIGAPSRGTAQQPVPGPSTVPYRAPGIALVQPASEATLPQDKPVVVFRFAQGEPNDPIDLASFAVAVDGHDRTRLFQVTAAEAWGPLSASVDRPNDASLAPGVHQLTARICSARGACAFTTASIAIVPGTSASQSTSQPAAAGVSADSSEKPAPSRRRRIIDALVAAAKKLLTP